MSGHALLIEHADSHTEDDPHFKSTVYCLTPAKCEGWEECAGDHTGYDPNDEDSPAYDQEEDVEIHGVLHNWHGSHGWTTPFVGCVVAANDGIHDAVYEIGRYDGAGLHLIDTEWEDYDCVVTRVTVEDIRKAGRRSAHFGINYRLAEAECAAKCPEGSWGEVGDYATNPAGHDHRQAHIDGIKWAADAVAEHVTVG
jgi:hypothetical protein